MRLVAAGLPVIAAVVANAGLLYGLAQAPATPPVQPGQSRPANLRAQQKFELGFSLARQGNNAEAIEAFREAVQLNSDLIEAHFSLAVLLARQGKPGYAEAMRQFLEVLRLNPSDVDALINVSNLLEAEGDLTASVTTMQKAVGLAAEKPPLYLMLAQKQDKAGQYPDAVESFREALKSGSPQPGARFGLGMALKHLRRFEEAIPQFEAVLRLNPGDPLAHFELGAVESEQGQFTAAVAHLQEAARLQPGMVEAYVELGRVYRILNRSEDSKAAYRKAVELKSDQLSALYGLARNPQDQREAAELFAKIRQLQARSGTSGKADDANGVGIRLMAEGRLDEALAAFRRALADNPSFALAAYNMGVVLAQQGQMREAAEAFRKAINLRPGFSTAHFGLGLVLQASKDPTADKEFRAAKMLDDLSGQQSHAVPKP